MHKFTKMFKWANNQIIKIYKKNRIKIKSKIQYYKDKMIRNRRLNILCYRLFKILSYNKNAKRNKHVFNFASKTSADLADLTSVSVLRK